MTNEVLAGILRRKLDSIGVGLDQADALLASMQVETKVANEDYLEFLAGRLECCDPRQKADFQQRFDGLSSIKGQKYFSVWLRNREGTVSYLAGVDKIGGRILYFVTTS